MEVMRKVMLLGLVIGSWWMWRSDDEAVAPRVQAGVLRDGFTVLVDRQVHELDRDARPEHQMSLQLADEVRFVGTSRGSTVGWKDGKKLKLAALDDDGNPDEPSTWGNKVTQLCEGAASNEHRFGIGWLEADNRVWIVHGPMRASELAIDALELDTDAAKVTWCGVASAGPDLALLWRDGNKLKLNFCTPKACSAYVTKVPVPGEEQLLGFGCVRDACLFASRDRSQTVLRRVFETGRSIKLALSAAADDTRVEIVGTGPRRFALGYLDRERRAVVELRGIDGSVEQSWSFDEREVPALRWDGARLLVAFSSGKFTALQPDER